MDSSGLGYSERKRVKAAYMSFLEQFEADCFVTLVTNDDGTIEGMRALIRNFLARVDRKMLGNAWLERPRDERTDGVFFIEHVSSNIHAHGLVRMAKNDKVNVQNHCQNVWGKLCPSGSVLIETPDSERKVAFYITKEFVGGRFADDQIVLTRELMPF